MKPQLLKVSKDLIHSFSARRDVSPDINNRWHYHPELELVYFKKGHGTQFVGDKISPFKAGDIVLLGANLPHYWQFDQSYFETINQASVDVLVVHFEADFWGRQFSDLPENVVLKDLFEQARRGLKLLIEKNAALHAMMNKVIETEGTRKLISLIDVLLTIGESKNKTLISSLGFNHSFSESEKDRINAVYNYALSNFKKRITLEEIASVANISPTSFCKYFKSRTRKTFSNFINEIRVSNACKLLIEGELHVKEVCYESGFYNFTNFHKYFKQITGKSPAQYQKSFS